MALGDYEDKESTKMKWILQLSVQLHCMMIFLFFSFQVQDSFCLSHYREAQAFLWPNPPWKREPMGGGFWMKPSEKGALSLTLSKFQKQHLAKMSQCKMGGHNCHTKGRDIQNIHTSYSKVSVLCIENIAMSPIDAEQWFCWFSSNQALLKGCYK